MEEKLSPMMQNYMETKEAYSDCILFYRLGDFYEMFYDDALTASRELELTLTGKNCGLKERAPMCGVPFHAAQIYINKLVKKLENIFAIINHIYFFTVKKIPILEKTFLLINKTINENINDKISTIEPLIIINKYIDIYP